MLINKGLFAVKEKTVEELITTAPVCAYCGERVGARAIYSGKHKEVFCSDDCYNRMEEQDGE